MNSKVFLDQLMIQIKHYREELGLSQDQIAGMLKIGNRSYQRYECGESIPSVSFFFHASQILGFEPKDLFSPFESLPKIGEISFFAETQKQEFISAAGEVRDLFAILDSPFLESTLSNNQLNLLDQDQLFQTSHRSFAISTPKMTLLNPAAQRAFGFSTNTIPTASFHSTPIHVGILWGALLQVRPAYFIMDVLNSVRMSNIFLRKNQHYFILRQLGH